MAAIGPCVHDPLSPVSDHETVLQYIRENEAFTSINNINNPFRIARKENKKYFEISNYM